MGRPRKLESLGTRIKTLRKGMLITQEQLARKANMSYVSLVKLENDKVDNPSFQTIYKLSKVFDITLDDFVNGVMDDKILFRLEY
jgi:transcriptional regulator with XRE-family HTH domain